MQTLLVVAIIVTGLAILVQAGVLLAMYILSRRVANNVNGLVNEGHKLSAPMERIATNFRAASEDVAQIGKGARGEFTRLEALLKETQIAIRDEVQNLRSRANATMDEAHHTAMRPVREWSAMATGFAAGVRSFFDRRRRKREVVIIDETRKTPAA
jgi:hypothetical protein